MALGAGDCCTLPACHRVRAAARLPIPLMTGTPSLSDTTIAWRPSTLQKIRKKYFQTEQLLAYLFIAFPLPQNRRARGRHRRGSSAVLLEGGLRAGRESGAHNAEGEARMELLVTSAASCRGTSSDPAGTDNAVTRPAPRPTERGRSTSRPPQPPVPPNRPARLSRAYVGHGWRPRGAAAPSVALRDKKVSCQRRRRPTEGRAGEGSGGRASARPSPPAPPREGSGAGARPPHPEGHAPQPPSRYLSALRAALPSARPALPFNPPSADGTRKLLLTRGAADRSRRRPPSMRS